MGGKRLPIEPFFKDIRWCWGIEGCQKRIRAHDDPVTVGADDLDFSGIHDIREQPRVPQFSEGFPIGVPLGLANRGQVPQPLRPLVHVGIVRVQPYRGSISMSANLQ